MFTGFLDIGAARQRIIVRRRRLELRVVADAAMPVLGFAAQIGGDRPSTK